MLRLILLLLIVTGLTLFTLQNVTPIALVILGSQTPALPLSVWILGAIAAGAATTVLLAVLTRLGSTPTARFARSPSRLRDTEQPLWDTPPRNPSRTSSPRNGRDDFPNQNRDPDWSASDRPPVSGSSKRNSPNRRTQLQDDWDAPRRDMDSWEGWADPGVDPGSGGDRFSGDRFSEDEIWPGAEDDEPPSRFSTARNPQYSRSSPWNARSRDDATEAPGSYGTGYDGDSSSEERHTDESERSWEDYAASYDSDDWSSRNERTRDNRETDYQMPEDEQWNRRTHGNVDSSYGNDYDADYEQARQASPYEGYDTDYDADYDADYDVGKEYEASAYTEYSSYGSGEPEQTVPAGYQPVYYPEDDEDQEDWENWDGYEDLQPEDVIEDTSSDYVDASYVDIGEEPPDSEPESDPGSTNRSNATDVSIPESSSSQRTTFEVSQEPTASYRSGSLYSFSYRNEQDPETATSSSSSDQEASNQRVLTTPYHPDPDTPSAKKPEEDEDWGFEEADESR